MLLNNHPQASPQLLDRPNKTFKFQVKSKKDNLAIQRCMNGSLQRAGLRFLPTSSSPAPHIAVHINYQ